MCLARTGKAVVWQDAAAMAETAAGALPGVSMAGQVAVVVAWETA